MGKHTHTETWVIYKSGSPLITTYAKIEETHTHIQSGNSNTIGQT